MTLEECAGYCKKVFGLSQVKVFGDPQAVVEKAAVVPGSGKDYIQKAAEEKADVIITGDIGHHNGIDAMAQGLSVIDAGHYGLEKIFVPYMTEAFGREMPGLQMLVAKEENPFWMI